MLIDDHPVVVAGVAVIGVAAGARELGDIVALEVRASRQDDVGEERLTFHPDGLVDDTFQLRALVHPHPVVGLGHRAEEGAAVAVEHLHFGAALSRVGVGDELLLDGLAAKAFPQP